MTKMNALQAVVQELEDILQNYVDNGPSTDPNHSSALGKPGVLHEREKEEESEFLETQPSHDFNENCRKDGPAVEDQGEMSKAELWERDEALHKGGRESRELSSQFADTQRDSADNIVQDVLAEEKDKEDGGLRSSITVNDHHSRVESRCGVGQEQQTLDMEAEPSSNTALTMSAEVSALKELAAGMEVDHVSKTGTVSTPIKRPRGRPRKNPPVIKQPAGRPRGRPRIYPLPEYLPPQKPCSKPKRSPRARKPQKVKQPRTPAEGGTNEALHISVEGINCTEIGGIDVSEKLSEQKLVGSENINLGFSETDPSDTGAITLLSKGGDSINMFPQNEVPSTLSPGSDIGNFVQIIPSVPCTSEPDHDWNLTFGEDEERPITPQLCGPVLGPEDIEVIHEPSDPQTWSLDAALAGTDCGEAEDHIAGKVVLDQRTQYETSSCDDVNRNSVQIERPSMDSEKGSETEPDMVTNDVVVIQPKFGKLSEDTCDNQPGVERMATISINFGDENTVAVTPSDQECFNSNTSSFNIQSSLSEPITPLVIDKDVQITCQGTYSKETPEHDSNFIQTGASGNQVANIVSDLPTPPIEKAKTYDVMEKPLGKFGNDADIGHEITTPGMSSEKESFTDDKGRSLVTSETESQFEREQKSQQPAVQDYDPACVTKSNAAVARKRKRKPRGANGTFLKWGTGRPVGRPRKTINVSSETRDQINKDQSTDGLQMSSLENDHHTNVPTAPRCNDGHNDSLVCDPTGVERKLQEENCNENMITNVSKSNTETLSSRGPGETQPLACNVSSDLNLGGECVVEVLEFPKAQKEAETKLNTEPDKQSEPAHKNEHSYARRPVGRPRKVQNPKCRGQSRDVCTRKPRGRPRRVQFPSSDKVDQSVKRIINLSYKKAKKSSVPPMPIRRSVGRPKKCFCGQVNSKKMGMTSRPPNDTSSKQLEELPKTVESTSSPSMPGNDLDSASYQLNAKLDSNAKKHQKNESQERSPESKELEMDKSVLVRKRGRPRKERNYNFTEKRDQVCSEAASSEKAMSDEFHAKIRCSHTGSLSKSTYKSLTLKGIKKDTRCIIISKSYNLSKKPHTAQALQNNMMSARKIIPVVFSNESTVNNAISGTDQSFLHIRNTLGVSHRPSLIKKHSDEHTHPTRNKLERGKVPTLHLKKLPLSMVNGTVKLDTEMCAKIQKIISKTTLVKEKTAGTRATTPLFGSSSSSGRSTPLSSGGKVLRLTGSPVRASTWLTSKSESECDYSTARRGIALTTEPEVKSESPKRVVILNTGQHERQVKSTQGSCFFSLQRARKVLFDSLTRVSVTGTQSKEKGPDSKNQQPQGTLPVASHPQVQLKRKRGRPRKNPNESQPNRRKDKESVRLKARSRQQTPSVLTKKAKSGNMLNSRHGRPSESVLMVVNRAKKRLPAHVPSGPLRVSTSLFREKSQKPKVKIPVGLLDSPNYVSKKRIRRSPNNSTMIVMQGEEKPGSSVNLQSKNNGHNDSHMSSAVQVVRKRGRPRKKSSEPDIKIPVVNGHREQDSSNASSAMDSAKSQSPPEVGVKRKRGRPRKYPVKEVSLVPRKRGRPRKNPISPVSQTPKKRGRPRKQEVVEECPRYPSVPLPITDKLMYGPFGFDSQEFVNRTPTDTSCNQLFMPANDSVPIADLDGSGERFPCVSEAVIQERRDLGLDVPVVGSHQTIGTLANNQVQMANDDHQPITIEEVCQSSTNLLDLVWNPLQGSSSPLLSQPAEDVQSSSAPCPLLVESSEQYMSAKTPTVAVETSCQVEPAERENPLTFLTCLRLNGNSSVVV